MAAPAAMKSTSRRVFSRFSTTSPSVFTYNALKSLRHHSSGKCASRSATGPRHERAEGRLGRFAFDGITMVDDGPPGMPGSRLVRGVGGPDTTLLAAGKTIPNKGSPQNATVLVPRHSL